MSLLSTASLVVTPNGYKINKLFSVIPSDGSGDLNVVRTTNGSRIGPNDLVQSVSINTPRLDYSNGTCPSLLVEPQRTNLNTFSTLLGAYTISWGASGSVTRTDNYAISPNGSLSAGRVQLLRGDNFASIYKRVSTTVGQVYTLSFWGKSLSGSPTLYTCFNNNYENPVTFSNEWVRYTYTYTAAVSLTGFELTTRVSLPSTSATADVLIWGVQLELGNYATSYIPTSSTIITRNADTGTTNLSSSILNSSEGVLFLDYQPLNTLDSFPVDFQLQYNGDNVTNGVTIYQAGNIPSVTVRSGGSTIFAESLTATTTGTRNKIAIAYKQNDYAVYQNGVLIASQSSGVAPAALNQIRISDGLRHFSINAAALWTTRLTNTQLAQLTTI